MSAVLADLRRNGKIRVAMLFGSFAGGKPHERSDIDLAVYVVAGSEGEEIAIVDKILMSSERDVAILRLDDDDESPFIVQEALKGEHLVEPDVDTLYDVSLRALHEAESIRFRRGVEMVHGG
ncbi:MAG: nucleotidyltransferase domain-containing protein [Nitrospirae bacterium]|nr:nucleotidyltransferase domain-containing protein [Nitrospirota bacterium]